MKDSNLNKPLDIKFQQRFTMNLATNVFYFILQFIVGIALVPFFIDTLGPAAYGLIPLATSITSYVVMVLDAMNASISRFLSIDLQRGDFEEAMETYSTSRFGVFAIILILIPVAILVAALSPLFLNIGDETFINVFWLFAFVLLSALTRALSAPFTAVFVAYNRVDYTNYVNITNLVVQLILVIILFLIFSASLIIVGISYFIAAVLSVLLAYILFKKTTPHLRISKHKFSKDKLIQIGDQAFWSVFHQIGLLLRYPICLIIVNIIYGDIAGTEFSLGITICTAIFAVSSIVTSTFRPQIYLYRAMNNINGMVNFCSFAIKIVGLMMALPIALVCIFSSQVLTLWVGEEFAHIYPIIWIMVLPIMFQITSSCTGPINAAYLKVRPVALNITLFGIINVILAFVIPNICNNSIYGVGIACAVSLIGISGVFSPLYNAYIINAKPLVFIIPMVWGWLGITVLIIFGFIYQILFSVDSFLTLLTACTILSLVYAVLIRFVLKKEERKIIRECIPISIRKRLPMWVI